MKLITQKDARDAIKKYGSIAEVARNSHYSKHTITRLAAIPRFPSNEEIEDFIEKNCGITSMALAKRIRRLTHIVVLTWVGGVRMKTVNKVRKEDRIIGYYDNAITPAQLKEDLLWAIENYTDNFLF